MIRHDGTVNFPARATIVASWQPGCTIVRGHEPHDIKFTYRDSRPFEVEMIVLGEDGKSWMFARSIIFDGIKKIGRGGIADVQVYNDGEMFCYMRLESRDGWCVLRFQLSQMERFADEMHALVPIGAEKIDMDLVIAKILMRGTR